MEHEQMEWAEATAPPPGAALESTRRLAELGDAARLVFTHHYGYAVADAGFLAELADGVARIEAGDVALVPIRDIIGGACLEARFPHFSVTQPDPTAPAATLVADG